MINEVLEAERYIKGEGVNPNNMYRTCYMIARLLRGKGLSNIEVRESIFDWANDANLYIPFNLNKMLYHVANNECELRGETPVYISKQDVRQIDRHFDGKVTKRVALAVLCYAKVTADANGEFQLSSNALSNWVGIASANLRGRHLKELCDFEYITNVTKEHEAKRWRHSEKTYNPSNWYRINVPHDNVDTGDWCLEADDINRLFKSIYG